jgi:methionyl-tRNA formyltransferase
MSTHQDKQWTILTAGNQLCIDVLAKLHEKNVINTIIVDNETKKWQKSTPKKLSLLYKYNGVKGLISLLLNRIYSAKNKPTTAAKSKTLNSNLQQIANEIGAELIYVDDINSPSTEKLLQNLDVTYGMLIGTSIIKQPIIDCFSKLLVNIHQGKIPEYRGGSIVFWSLFNDVDEFSVTTHKVEVAVDSGEIYETDTLSIPYCFKKYGLEYEGYLKDVIKQLDVLSAPIIVNTILHIEKYKATPKTFDISKGKRYRKPTYKEKKLLIKKLKKR